MSILPISKSKLRCSLERDFLTAAQKGKKDKVTELLEMVNVNIKDSRGHTALIRASAYDHTEVVRLLQ